MMGRLSNTTHMFTKVERLKGWQRRKLELKQESKVCMFWRLGTKNRIQRLFTYDGSWSYTLACFCMFCWPILFSVRVRWCRKGLEVVSKKRTKSVATKPRNETVEKKSFIFFISNFVKTKENIRTTPYNNATMVLNRHRTKRQWIPLRGRSWTKLGEKKKT